MLEKRRLAHRDNISTYTISKKKKGKKSPKGAQPPSKNLREQEVRSLLHPATYGGIQNQPKPILSRCIIFFIITVMFLLGK